MRITRQRLEKYGFNVQKVEDGYEIQQYTPAGEDWCLFFRKLEEIKTYAEYFDEGEEFSMWVQAKQDGVRGVPEYSELWQDQLWKKEILKSVAGV